MAHAKFPGKFITFEGIEGVGKSTAVAFLQNYLQTKNIPVITTREPGGTPIAEAIRKILLQHFTEKMLPQTELLLLFAGRAQHLVTVIIPALQAGKWVLCDRFTDASYAYQGGGRGIPADEIEVLENWVQGELRPDLTILLDAEVMLSQQRIQQRAADRIERESPSFFENIRRTYLKRAEQYKERYRIIDAGISLPQVQQQLVACITELQRKC